MQLTSTFSLILSPFDAVSKNYLLQAKLQHI